MVNGESQSFARTLSPESMRFKQEKITHLHFYFHDIVSGRNPTAVRVAEAPITNKSATFFGAVVVMDDPLTETPELTSKAVGRAQGIYSATSQSELSFLLAFNFVFSEGKYNGSTLSVLGREPVGPKVRELPVIGGSGIFRFARGYALVKTQALDLKTGDAVLEYDVFVIHY
nr:TPA_asm: hypothetical protein HUJ06_000375 [Nelumbo nucifera]